jgi:lipoyl synthase
LEADKKPLDKPGWLKKKVFLNNQNIARVNDLILDLNLHTVCQNAKCPNIFECFSNKTATFLLLGNICSRNCAFCSVESGKPLAVDENEPDNIASAVAALGLKYIVLTSVTRDDLADGGAGQFAKTLRRIKTLMPEAKVECLIPDFKNETKNLEKLLREDLDVLNHNIETVKENYTGIRNGADYQKSLKILGSSKYLKPEIITKSGFMLGLGERIEEVYGLLKDLKSVNCDIVTIGQYLCPGKNNIRVQKYYSPEEFAGLENYAKNMGFKYVISGVFVRSSYLAAKAFKSSGNRSLNNLQNE